MRASRQTEVDYDVNGWIQCFYLHADFVSEHEHGIQPLYDTLGVVPGEPGIESYRVRNVPEGTVLLEEVDGTTYLRVTSSWADKYIIPKNYGIRQMLPIDDTRPYTSGWGERNFIIATRIPVIAKELQALAEAFRTNDAFIVCGSKSNRPNAKDAILAVGICSRLSPEDLEMLRESDKARIAFLEAVQERQVSARLTAAGFSIPRCDPTPTASVPDRLKSELSTVYPEVYWLRFDSEDSQPHKTGYYTVEEIESMIVAANTTTTA